MILLSLRFTHTPSRQMLLTSCENTRNWNSHSDVWVSRKRKITLSDNSTKFLRRNFIYTKKKKITAFVVFKVERAREIKATARDDKYGVMTVMTFVLAMMSDRGHLRSVLRLSRAWIENFSHSGLETYFRIHKSPALCVLPMYIETSTRKKNIGHSHSHWIFIIKKIFNKKRF